MNNSIVKVCARMSSNSCDNESDGKFSSASNRDFMQQNKSVNVNSSISKPETLKNAQIENWITRNLEYLDDKENICNDAPMEECFTDKSEYWNHSQCSPIPHGNYQEHYSVSINDSLTKDCDTNKLATIQLLPAKDMQIPSSLKSRPTEGTLLNSPCNSKAQCMYLMEQMTSDPTKSAQLEAIPVTSLKSYKESIRHNPNISYVARENMLQVLDDLREMDSRNRSTLNVQLQQTNGDSETVDTSSVNVCQPVIKCSESETFSGENINNAPTSMLIHMTDCTSGTDENNQALKTHNGHTYPRHTTMLTAYQSDNRNYMYKNKRSQRSNSLACIEFKKSCMKHRPQLTSDSSTRRAHQQLVYTRETFAQLGHFKYSSMHTRQYPHMPMSQELVGMRCKTESNVEHHPYDSPGKLKNKLTLHGSYNLEELSSGDGSDVQGRCLSSVQVPLQSIEPESEAGTPLQCNSYSLHNTADSEDSSSELDEEPLTQESSSSSVECLDISSSPEALNWPTFPRHISERKLGRESTSTRCHNKPTSSFAYSESSTDLRQSVEEHANSPSFENGSLVLRHKRRKLLPNVHGAAARNKFNQRPVKIPSLVDMCMQVLSVANTTSTLDELHLCRLAENAHCETNKSSINSKVTKHDGSTPCPYKNFISNLKSNGGIHEGSLPTTVNVDNSRSPDTIRNAKYPTGISSSLVTLGVEHSSQETFLDCTSSTDDASYSNQGNTEQRSYDNDSDQSPELNIPDVCCQYISLDIKESMAIVE